MKNKALHICFLFIYSLSLVAPNLPGVLVEEVVEVEEVEVVLEITEEQTSKEIIKKKNYVTATQIHVSKNPTSAFGSSQSSYIKTTFHKLPILYCCLLLDRPHPLV